MTQIYYNKEWPLLDLAESHIYNNDCGLGCGTTAMKALKFIRDNGIVSEECFPYPSNENHCEADCDTMCQNPQQRVTIPMWDSVTVSTVSELKQAIMDKGPLVANITGGGYVLHGGSAVDHAVLIIGWRYDNQTLQWHIKDSWPGTQDLYYFSFNILEYCTKYYSVKHFYNNEYIECVAGTDCSLFSRSTPVDNDGDGFYNWGFDKASKPNGASYPNLMDFNDGDNSKIFRDGFTIYSKPIVSGTSGKVCQSGGDPSGYQFGLSPVPPGFSSSWYISKNAYCFNTYQGSNNPVTIYPNSTCTGKESEITFRITQNGDGGYAEYKKSFYVNCPREDLMSYYVLDSYGISPPKYGDTYYLCPYTYYTIYFNENDPSCVVTGLEWDLPYGWSKNYEYSNYVSIYTNDVPDGFLEIKGYTTCSPSAKAILMSPYFGAAECGGYFLAFPNPAGNFVDIDVDKNKLNAEKIIIEGECLLTIVDKSGMIKFKTEFIGFPYRIDTANLPEGLYFVNIIHKGKTSTIRLVIKH